MGAAASVVSALPGVRRLLVERQRALGSGADIVMEGRDIGTNVFPDAEVKVFLTARPEVRAARRAAELRAKGEDVDVDEVLAALLERDRRDSEREVAPLRKAADAVEVDTSELTLDEVVDAVVAIARREGRVMMGLWGYPLKGHGDSRLYTFFRWLAVPFFGGLYRCRVRGAEHLPRTGPAIVIMNHKAFCDPVIAGMIFDRPLRYMAKKELFANPRLRSSSAASARSRSTAARATARRSRPRSRSSSAARCCSCSPRGTGSGTTPCTSSCPASA